ncbi:MAG TPA: hypothetical protein PKI93_00935 [Alphaproteobacteria bacterium]|nr:hypothetical protein [Alphaproteobacteria bacterium]HNS44518.1 hypothetical protein [Alphaproteobacteria bacterium]
MMTSLSSQRGSAIVYVFIGVILFAALALTFSRGMQGTTGDASRKTAKVRSSQILEYADKINMATQKLLLKGCSETELNFEHTYSDNGLIAWAQGTRLYNNPLAPVDGRCDIFEPNGKMKPVLFSQLGIPASAFGGYALSDRLHFTSYIMSVQGVGDDTYIDLTFQSMVDVDTCNEINKALGIEAASPPQSELPYGGNGYTGTFTAGAGRQINPVGSPLHGKDTGCYYSYEATKQAYFFYKTLIAK